MKKVSGNSLQQPRHYFWLNPYREMAFTRCPKCERKTRVRKKRLAIDVLNKTLLLANVINKYCPKCDLIITSQEKIENMLNQLTFSDKRSIRQDDYFIFGTIERTNYNKCMNQGAYQSDGIKLVNPFIDKLHFKIRPAGWYKDK